MTALLTTGGCGSDATSGPRTPSDGPAMEPRETAFEHEPCDLESSGARELPTAPNGPRVIRVFDGERELCRAVDLNGDDAIDSFRYFDANGQTRRRESGFRSDNLPGQVSFFEGGVIVKRHRETNNDRKIDTWDYYEGGRLARSERDATGDGFIDQWWVFNRPGDEACALVTSDADGDGEPDPDSEIDICADRAPAEGAPASATSATNGDQASSADGEPEPAPPDEAGPPAETRPQTETGPEAETGPPDDTEAGPEGGPSPATSPSASPSPEGSERP
ncbi:MAG: hypothetical protein AAF715_09035 [Myxococcota bacterium]